MKTATRVLQCVRDGRVPAAADLCALERMVPSLAYLPPDELACEVIQRALRVRAGARCALWLARG